MVRSPQLALSLEEPHPRARPHRTSSGLNLKLSTLNRLPQRQPQTLRPSFPFRNSTLSYLCAQTDSGFLTRHSSLPRFCHSGTPANPIPSIACAHFPSPRGGGWHTPPPGVFAKNINLKELAGSGLRRISNQRAYRRIDESVLRARLGFPEAFCFWRLVADLDLAEAGRGDFLRCADNPEFFSVPLRIWEGLTLKILSE
jgi:hypothetical protein